MERTIIVVDDEPIIRLDLCQMLEELGFAVAAEGADGFDAVELCRQKRRGSREPCGLKFPWPH